MFVSDEMHFRTGISDHDIDLIFFVNEDAYPSVVIGDITLEFNGTVRNDERVSIQLLNVTIVASISRLRLFDTGNYTVTVTTVSGMDSAWAFLQVHG